MPLERAVVSRSPEGDNATDPASPLADYYRWVEPDRGTRIYINFETANRLQMQVLHGQDSNGGVEVGGILLGRSKLDKGRITAVVEDFEPVPCAYSNGPLYSATSSDAARFEAALKRYESGTNSGLSIIGYFRSHKRNDLYLSADDLTLIQRVFPGSGNVFLLIKPLSGRACTGGFYFWDDGNIQSEFTLEVPFAPVQTPSPAPSATDAADVLLLPVRLDLSKNLTTIPPELSQQPGLQPGLPPGLPRHDPWLVRTRDLQAAALATVLSLGVFGFWQLRRTSLASHAPADREMTNTGQHPPISPITHSTPAEKPPIPSSSRQPRPAAPAGVFQTPDTQQQAAPPAESGATAAVPDAKLEEAPSLPGQTLPGQTVPVSSTAAAPPPPALQNITPAEIAPTRAEPAMPSPAPPDSAVPNAETAPPQPPAKTTFFGPQITYRVNPVVPLEVRSLISGETQIDVTVTIDAAGKVTGAQVTSTKGAAARLVAAEAIKAARLCRFQPARENGRAVQSKMVLTFRFRRTGE